MWHHFENIELLTQDDWVHCVSFPGEFGITIWGQVLREADSISRVTHWGATGRGVCAFDFRTPTA